jgi:hypothetical protein
MPIHKNSTTERRTSLSPYQVSQWTDKTKGQALYDSLAARSDSDMRGSDNLKFDPRSMIGHASVTQANTDISYQRMEHLQMKPVYMYAGGFILFLVVMKYLTSSK